jgi:hypothetical protein
LLAEYFIMNRQGNTKRSILCVSDDCYFHTRTVIWKSDWTELVISLLFQSTILFNAVLWKGLLLDRLYDGWMDEWMNVLIWPVYRNHCDSIMKHFKYYTEIQMFHYSDFSTHYVFGPVNHPLFKIKKCNSISEINSSSSFLFFFFF